MGTDYGVDRGGNLMQQPLVTDIAQIGVVVENVNETIQNYQKILGLDDWHINYVDTRKGLGTEFRFRNKEVDVKAKIAWITIGNVELELIEPQDEDSLYAKFLKEKGPGLHHIMLAPENFEQCKQTCLDHHVPLLVEGKLQQTEFALLDSLSKMGMVIEIAKGEPLVPDESVRNGDQKTVG
jgi:hypothetical protein